MKYRHPTCATNVICFFSWVFTFTKIDSSYHLGLLPYFWSWSSIYRTSAWVPKIIPARPYHSCNSSIITTSSLASAVRWDPTHPRHASKCLLGQTLSGSPRAPLVFGKWAKILLLFVYFQRSNGLGSLKNKHVVRQQRTKKWTSELPIAEFTDDECKKAQGPTQRERLFSWR